MKRIKGYVTAVFVLFCSHAFAQFTITDNFEGSNINNNIFLSGNPNPAVLTSGVQDPVNNGWLRITSDITDQQGYGYIKSSFPATLGVLLDFEYKTWRAVADPGNGADGFSVFFFDADSAFSPGGLGGSLNYAPNTVAGQTKGLAGGYLGVGLDEFGNFSNPTEGRVGGPGVTPNAIVLRGPTTNNPATTNTYLTGFQVNPSTTANAVDYNTVTATRPTDAQFYRRVQIQIVPSAGSFIVTVKWTKTPNGAFTTLLTYTMTTPPPANLKVGFGASTGGSFNFHEMRNLIITTPGNVRLSKSVDSLSVHVGNKVTYSVNVFNSTAAALNGLLFADTIKDGNGNTLTLSPTTFTVNSVTFNNGGNAGNTAVGYTSGTPVTSGFTNPLTTSLNMVANSSSLFTVVGTVNAIPAAGVVENSAGIDPTPTGISDPDLTNNYFTVTSNVLSPNVDLVLTKTLDNTCADPVNGNTYTITVSNNGSNATAIGVLTTVTDNIPAGFTVSSASGTGWTQSNVGNFYSFSRTDVLASGFSYPPIAIKVTPPAGGSSQVNTATVAYAGVESNTTNNTATATLNPSATIALSSAPATANQTLTVNTSITPITYTIGGSATGATVTGLPTGVTGAFSSGTFTISGKPTAMGTFNYTVTTTGGCSLASSGGTIGTFSALPVKLTDFTVNADQGRARLDWTTAIETNNTGFEIDRSTDGDTWSNIGFAPTKAVNGNSDQPLSYTFFDNAPSNGIDYYRLKQIDLDGNAAYSIILTINFGAGSKIILSPNPADAMVTIAGVSPGQVVRLVDMGGRIWQQTMVAGNTQVLSLGRLANGAYVVQVVGNGKVIQSIKLLKARP